ncbi:hypothetical protein CXK97_18640 [Stutzerimonas stutzeri]|nr:hypothetical protein CXK97_18640 [Stutzerimonas stutzeri]
MRSPNIIWNQICVALSELYQFFEIPSKPHRLELLIYSSQTTPLICCGGLYKRCSTRITGCPLDARIENSHSKRDHRLSMLAILVRMLDVAFYEALIRILMICRSNKIRLSNFFEQTLNLSL